MAKIKDEIVVEVVTRGVAKNINGKRYVDEEAAVCMSKSGLNMGKDLGNIEVEEALITVGLFWAVYGGGIVVYNIYQDEIKKGFNKLKDKWNDLRK